VNGHRRNALWIARTIVLQVITYWQKVNAPPITEPVWGWAMLTKPAVARTTAARLPVTTAVRNLGQSFIGDLLVNDKVHVRKSSSDDGWFR
jgi:hypothetical protein